MCDKKQRARTTMLDYFLRDSLNDQSKGDSSKKDDKTRILNKGTLQSDKGFTSICSNAVEKVECDVIPLERTGDETSLEGNDKMGDDKNMDVDYMANKTGEEINSVNQELPSCLHQRSSDGKVKWCFAWRGQKRKRKTNLQKNDSKRRKNFVSEESKLNELKGRKCSYTLEMLDDRSFDLVLPPVIDYSTKFKKDVHLCSANFSETPRITLENKSFDVHESSATVDAHESIVDVDENTSNVDEGTDDIRNNTNDFPMNTVDVNESNAAYVYESTAFADVHENTADVPKSTIDFRESTISVDESPTDVHKSPISVDECAVDVDEVDKSTVDVLKSTVNVDESAADVRKNTTDVHVSTICVDESTVVVHEVDESTADVLKSIIEVHECAISVDESPADVPKSTIDAHESTISVDESTADVPKSTIDVHESTLSVDKITADVTKSTIDVHESTISVDESTVAVHEVDESNADVPKNIIDLHECTISIDESTANAPKSTIDAHESTISIDESTADVPKSTIDAHESTIGVDESTADVHDVDETANNHHKSITEEKCEHKKESQFLESEDSVKITLPVNQILDDFESETNISKCLVKRVENDFKISFCEKTTKSDCIESVENKLLSVDTVVEKKLFDVLMQNSKALSATQKSSLSVKKVKNLDGGDSKQLKSDESRRSSRIKNKNRESKNQYIEGEEISISSKNTEVTFQCLPNDSNVWNNEINQTKQKKKVIERVKNRSKQNSERINRKVKHQESIKGNDCRSQRRARRIRKECILSTDDSEDEMKDDAEGKQHEISPVKKKEKRGPIAPIFLPGAWSRAKTKLFEVENLEKMMNKEEDEMCAQLSRESSQTKAVTLIPNTTVDRDIYFPIPTCTKPLNSMDEAKPAPFPKVSHVVQYSSDMELKLSMKWNKFVREEFFVALSSPHISDFNQRHTCRNLLVNTSISSALKRKFYDFKDVNIPTMEKEKKHKILLHLKAVYIGVPIIRLFKRCHQQLEFQKKVFIRDRRMSLKAMERKNSNTAGDSAASSEEYCLSHWKKLKTIETKNSYNKTKRMKTNKAESPILKAFQKQDNKKKSKQEQNVSIMNFVKTSEKQHSEEELNRQSPFVPRVRTRNSSRLTSVKTAAEVEENIKGRKRKKDVFEKETRLKVKNKPQKKQHEEDANEIDASQSKNEVLNQALCCGNEMESDNFSPLWSELFKPMNSSEIIGNSGAGVRLKKWLTEWKCLREERLNYLKKQEEKNKERLTKKKSKTTRSSIDWSDSDSDFYSSNDQNDAFDTKQICNSMLLSGPCGCGKTSSVYACAEELGFKVIEVNATTKRGGKYILSELLEATQSHQVSTKHDETTGILHVVNSEVETKKDHVTHEENKKDKKRKLKTKSENYFTETQLQGQMSLILLDEVDVLFEEDKGFWLAVNTIRKSSKRPIIMTASDTSAVEIDGEYEHIKLRSPSLAFYAAHLQTVCLSKNVFVNPHDIQALSSLYYPDIRRLLLCLQFWVDSFGGALDKHGVRIMDGSVDGSILSSGISSNNAIGNIHKNSANVKDEMNNDGLSTPCNDGKTQLSSKDGTSHPVEWESTTIPTGSNEGNKSEVNHFSMHKYCLESLLGLGNISTTYDNILDCLRPVNKKSFWEKCFLTSHCQSLNLDIVHCNIKHLLPINVTNESSNVKDKRKKNELAEDANRTDFQKKMNAISIETLSRFYEDMSFMNAELSTRDDDRKSLWDFQLPSPKISPGLEDSFPSPGKQTWESKNFMYNLRGALEVASLNYNHSYINERRKRFEDKFVKHSVDMPTSILSSRPDKTEMNCLKNSNGIAIRCYEMSTNRDRHVEVSPCTESILRKSKKQHQIACDVSTYLSEHSFLHWRNTVMDYIPTLQCMCVQECRRREARTKRRFYHYFDSVGLNISSSLIQSLVEENSLT